LFSWDDAFMHGGPFAVLADRCAPIRATRQRIRPLKKEQKVYTFGSQRRSPPPNPEIPQLVITLKHGHFVRRASKLLLMHRGPFAVLADRCAPIRCAVYPGLGP
jgi:hypothetical protein